MRIVLYLWHASSRKGQDGYGRGDDEGSGIEMEGSRTSKSHILEVLKLAVTVIALASGRFEHAQRLVGIDLMAVGEGLEAS